MSMITALSLNGSSLEGPQDIELPHVLLVLDQFPKTLGGGERIVLRLAALLPRYGYRASILTFSAHPESAGLQSPPCPIYLLPLQRTYDLAAEAIPQTAANSDCSDIFRELRSVGGIRNKDHVRCQAYLEPQRYGDSQGQQTPRCVSVHVPYS